MSTDQQSLYEIIGLPQDASRERIEEQCIRLGEQYRPDKNPADLRAALLFAQTEQAYKTLIDPEKRAAYDAELRSGAIAHEYAASIGTVGAPAQSAAALTGAASGGISLHSKINSWIAMLFLLAVFKVLSDVLSKLAASWLQTNNLGAFNVATVGAIAGVATAFVGTVIVGKFLAGFIPLWPPLSGILGTRGTEEITQGKRMLATLAMLALAPVVLVGGSITVDLQKKGSARIAADAGEDIRVHGLGATECSEYLSFRQKENARYDGATARATAEWTLGYLTGYNSATSERQDPYIPVATVVAYLDKYCRDQPLGYVAGAVGCLHATFGGPAYPYCK